MTDINTWIEGQTDSALAGICVEFARRFNSADPALSELYAEECQHASQMWPEKLDTPARVGEYFGRRFVGPTRNSIAELAVDPMQGDPCVLMSIRDSAFGRLGLGTVRSYITFELDARGLVKRSFAVSLAPDPRHCRRSDLYPGISEDDLQRERDFVGSPMPRNDTLGVSIFLMPGTGEQSCEFARSVERVAFELGLPTPIAEKLSGDNPEAVRFFVVAHPTVVLHVNGQTVRLIEGMYSAETIREVLCGALEGASEQDGTCTGDAGEIDYFGDSLSDDDQLLVRIKGDHRRGLIRTHLEDESAEEIPAIWQAHDLTPEFRDFLGAQFPGARGGEDLPDLLEGEVEIARMTLDSIHCEVTSLRALDLGGGRYSLRMVGEYEEIVYELPKTEFDRPLTCKEVVALFADAEPSPLDLECGGELSSFFYPEIEAVRRRLALLE